MFFALCGLFLSTVAIAAQETVFVRWVNDGDTIILADGRTIRYIGIDAPEIGHGDRGRQPLALEAKRFNQVKVLNKHVRLEFDQETVDHYGRKLAYVFSKDGTFINREMLLNGYACYYYHFPNIHYQSALLKAQRSAMKAAKGIWGNWNETADRYIGNKKSMRFHSKDCPMAQKISSANRVIFTKRWDAFWQGYSPAKECLPDGFLP